MLWPLIWTISRLFRWGVTTYDFSEKNYPQLSSKSPSSLELCFMVMGYHNYHISSVIRQNVFIPKQSQKSRAVLLHRSRYLGSFMKGKTRIIAKFHSTDLVIWSHFSEGKTLSYSRINMALKFLRQLNVNECNSMFFFIFLKGSFWFASHKMSRQNGGYSNWKRFAPRTSNILKSWSLCEGRKIESGSIAYSEIVWKHTCRINRGSYTCFINFIWNNQECKICLSYDL